MFLQNDAADPTKSLALAYAKGEMRAVLTVLLGLDLRLASIVQKGTEPLIGQMRMAWWREALQKPAEMRPKGEPLFQELAAISYNLPTDMIHLVDGWSVLLAHDEWTPDVLAAFAKDRSAGIFGGFAKASGADEAACRALQHMGERWALLDLRQYCKTQQEADMAQICLPPRPQNFRSSAITRPLSMLALAQEQSGKTGLMPGIRLIWHGLTGR